MNTIGIVILTALIVDFLIHTAADICNLASVRHDLPEAFRDVYHSDGYRKSQAYLNVNTRFGWVTHSVDLASLFAFWAAGGFAALDRWVRGVTLDPVMAGTLFIGTLFSLKSVISLPFGLYAAFVIEERFGFNRMTLKTFVLDRLKGLLLSVFLGLPLVSGILWFFEYAGPSAWWLSWLAVVLFMLVIHYVAPTWIMPLFNRFEPLQDGELKSAILAYARRIQFPLENIFVMDGSKRSRKANAFFTGFGNRKRIVLFDTLIEQHSVTELVAVIAHEMGHYKKKHILESLILGILQAGVIFFLLKILITYPPLFDAFGMPSVSVYGGLVFFALLYSPVDAVTGLLMLARSRRNEYEADRFAVATTQKGTELAVALKKLAANNLSNLVPHPFYVMLNYSHPPVLERIRAIHAMAHDTPSP